MVSATEENLFDAASLNVRKKMVLSIIEIKTDGIAFEFFGLDDRKRRIEMIGVAAIDRVDARHSRINDEMSYRTVTSMGLTSTALEPVFNLKRLP